MKDYRFDFITELDLIDEIKKTGTYLTFNAGTIIVQPERYIKVIPLVIKGTVKVLRVDEDGHELFLYYITTGQSCAVSLSSCITDKISNIRAVAEEDTELIAIPVFTAVKWFNTYGSWRNFVLQTMDTRFDNLIVTIDTLAFSKTDKRLISYLKAKAKAHNDSTINCTHQEIANELSTTREVISRLLKNFEKNGILKLYRNKIELISLMY
jgi:CRP/FNR family transcriptional regulator